MKRNSTLRWYSIIGTDHLKGENNPMYGIKRENYKPPFKGKNHSEESKLKISKSLSNRKTKVSKETKLKMSESAKKAHKIRKENETNRNIID